VRKAALASIELRDYTLAKQAPIAMLFAYRFDLTLQTELERLLDVLREIEHKPTKGQATSPIQAICVANKGAWILTESVPDVTSGWYFVPPTDQLHLFAFASIVSNSLFAGNSSAFGAGAYLLDPSWLQGPNPACPRIVP
jgi:hypothetical protein